jgi:hypothetical protein
MRRLWTATAGRDARPARAHLRSLRSQEDLDLQHVRAKRALQDLDHHRKAVVRQLLAHLGGLCRLRHPGTGARRHP